MKKTTLSKSSFIRGLQCEKSLYLYKHFYSLRDKLSDETLSKFARGHSVGFLAQQLFPDGINLKPYSPQKYLQSFLQTKMHIESGTSTIYEAGFNYHDIIAFLDILHYENGKWHAYEIKSSREISETYLMDASLQYYVILNSGVELESFNIVYINKDYVRSNELELDQLFRIKNVTEGVRKNLDFIRTKTEQFKAMLEEKQLPEIKIGLHCHDPYTCDFIGHCWKDFLKAKTIFSVPSFSDRQKFDLLEKGVINIEDIIEQIETTHSQKIQLDCIKNDTAYYDIPGLQNYFSEVRLPVLFAELLSCRPAIPMRSNTKPFQPVPFIWHSVTNSPDQESIRLFHEDISARAEDFSKKILSLIFASGTIMVYDEEQFLFSLETLKHDGFISELQWDEIKNKILDIKNMLDSNLYFNPQLLSGQELQSLSKSIFKTRISRERISSSVVASDLYQSLQHESDMFKIVEAKERLNEFAAFNLEVLIKVFNYFSDLSGCDLSRNPPMH